jgi:hypothetical protein
MKDIKGKANGIDRSSWWDGNANSGQGVIGRHTRDAERVKRKGRGNKKQAEHHYDGKGSRSGVICIVSRLFL